MGVAVAPALFGFMMDARWPTGIWIGVALAYVLMIVCANMLARHTLERIDNDGHYEPANCRWATMVEQGQNTSKTRRITIDGVTMGVLAWSRSLHMSTKRVIATFAK